MRILFLSDIHGVPSTLEAAFEAASTLGYDKIVLLGDLLYHGPRNGVPDFYDPVKVAKMLNLRKDGPDPDRRQLALVEEVSVRQEELLRPRVEDLVIRHHRELEHHLVHFRVAVAAHGDDLVLAEIQHLRDLHGIVEVRDSVPRTVVQEIAQQDDLVVAER